MYEFKEQHMCITLFVIEGCSDDAMEIIANCLKDSLHAKTLTSQCHFPKTAECVLGGGNHHGGQSKTKTFEKGKHLKAIHVQCTWLHVYVHAYFNVVNMHSKTIFSECLGKLTKK